MNEYAGVRTAFGKPIRSFGQVGVDVLVESRFNDTSPTPMRTSRRDEPSCTTW